MNKLDMQSKDIVNENIERISELFPNVIVESETGKSIDFDLLKQELSKEIVEGNKEKYQLTWPGKKEAILNANTQCNKVLRPVKEKSINFEISENVYIEGDNLEVLKILQQSYVNSIKCIYIDPPYNTGKDFIYKDSFNKKIELELQESGQIDEYSNRLVTNNESNGRFHSDWLSMMYSRLKLARNLLTDDGAICIHIDENEDINLAKICDEIFGENNKIGCIIWDKRNPKGSTFGVAYQHESILIYCKNLDEFSKIEFKKKKENAEDMLEFVKKLKKKYIDVNENAISEYKEWLKKNSNKLSGGEIAYSFIDNNWNIYQPVSMAAPDKPENRSHRPLIHPKTGKKCPVPEKGWRFTDSKMDELLNLNKIEFGDDEKTQPRQKYFLKDNLFESVSSIIYYGGSGEVKGIKFDNPKPVYIVKRILDTIVRNNDIVMDFFSGSGTTASAVSLLNSEDNGKRKFIMVQLPEKTCDDKTICDVGQMRIRQDLVKIKNETNADIDYGFRVYKVDSSNMKDIYYMPNEVKQNQLGMFENNIKEDRNAEDLLVQIILDLGLKLDLKIEEKDILNNKVYFVDENSLIACFDDIIDINIVDEICKFNPLRVVFKDEAFKTDNDKINLQERLKKKSSNIEICIL